jgi:Fic family protein
LSKNLEVILKEIDTLKAKLDNFRQFDSYSIAQALELEYTFESNRIEGNTLTLRETDLVINEGLTISGKSMREHLEAINHQEAIAYIKHLMEKSTNLNEREVLSIHNLILRGIHPEDAGRYRKVQVMIKGSSYMPPQPYIVAKDMEGFFIWYETNKKSLHPVILAAEMHERLVTIHPFIDGNGRTSRLVMNLILLQHGYIIANIKGDYESRMQYYQALETAQTKNNKEDFLLFIAQIEKESLERYISIIGQ